MRGLCSLLLLLLPAIALAGEKPPAGKFMNAECVGCHAKLDAKLIAAWRTSSHARVAPKADCIVCHGATHAGSLARARRDNACTGCHEKLNHAVVHSYATSKHATIVKLEEHEWDWSRPLARGNYRAPGCAYCHMHAGEHDTSSTIAKWNPLQAPDAALRETMLGRRQTVCGECHAPRYVAEQTGTGERMTEIARMKLREASVLVAPYRLRLPPPELGEVERLIAGMRQYALHVRLGAGHQSPDYQWWHGQPALDGGLLRIKGVIAEHERRKPAGQP